jgi:hypothetical protein
VRFSTSQYSLLLSAVLRSMTAEVELNWPLPRLSVAPLVGTRGLDQPRYCRLQASRPTGVVPGTSPDFASQLPADIRLK